MDKNFMDKFTLILKTVEVGCFIIAILFVTFFLAHFSHSMGSIETRIGILELQNPID